MQNKTGCCFTIIVILFFLLPGLLPAGELENLFNKVEKLEIQRHGYILGKALNESQLKIAKTTPLEATLEGTFKFKDKDLFVVAQENTNKVLVIFEEFEKADQTKAQDLVGDLYMNFEDPTVLAHDKVIYWAYTQKGKVSLEKFNLAKEEKKKLNILATVKLVSDIKIMEKQKQPLSGRVYYIISSDPVLKLLGASNS